MAASTTSAKGYTLLLTATINPGDYQELLDQQFLAKRYQEYRAALRYWVNYPDDRISSICFCENSAADLQPLIDEFSTNKHRPVEFLSFDGNQRPAGMHYGYAELGVIDFAVENSSSIRNSNHFIKVTGRLKMPLLTKLLDSCPPKLRFMADCHRYKADSQLPVRMRTQLLITEADFYNENLFETRHEMTSGSSFIEEFLIKKLWPLRNTPGIVLRFPIECQPQGYSASKGHNYDHGLSHLKSQIRSLVRRLAPNLWL